MNMEDALLKNSDINRYLLEAVYEGLINPVSPYIEIDNYVASLSQ